MMNTHIVDPHFVEIEVHNFGPIVDCRIDVRPLTVFVGPSNTGKSYLAILLYALHRSFSNAYIWHRLQQRFLGHNGLNQLLSSLKQSLREMETNTTDENAEARLTLLKPVTKVIKSLFDGKSDNISEELERCFGLSTDELVRNRSRGDASFSITSNKGSWDQSFQFKYSLKEKKITSHCPEEISIVVPDSAYLDSLKANLDLATQTADTHEGQFFFQHAFVGLLNATMPVLAGSLRHPAFYLPADRTGVMHAHSILVSSLIERAAMGGLRPGVDTPLLSGVLADFLEQLIVKRHRSMQTKSKSSAQIASDIEKMILGGYIQEERTEPVDYPRFKYLPKDWKKSISLINSSSMVSELAPVVLYLRDHVCPRDFLIVEEPESHLHPAKQVEFIRLLAKLVNLDIRVIVITHSEWVIEELGNIVQRSKQCPQNSYHGEDKVSIPANDIGVWLFQPKNRNGRIVGSHVKEIRVDESGLYPTDYDHVAQQLHNEWADISSTSRE